MMKISLDSSAVARRLKKIQSTAPRAVHGAMLSLADEVMDEAQKRVPRDTEALAKSRFVESGDGYVLLGYSASYALAVHEEPSSARATGEAFWLENALDSIANGGARKIALSATRHLMTGMGQKSSKYEGGT